MASLRELEPQCYPVAQWFVRLLASPQFARIVGTPVNVRINSVRRDATKQKALYDAYIAGRSKYPAAPPGSSPHALGIAFDITLTPPVYELAGFIWERLGLRWGGRFHDPIHFDFHPVGWVPPARHVPEAEVRARARLRA